MERLKKMMILMVPQINFVDLICIFLLFGILVVLFVLLDFFSVGFDGCTTEFVLDIICIGSFFGLKRGRDR